MKKVFLPILFLFYLIIRVNAQSHAIYYNVSVLSCDSSTFVQTMSDTIYEGESFIITENTLPGQFTPWQNLYDAVTGTRFGVEQGALNENITVGFNFMSLDCDNPGFYFDPSGNNNPLFLFMGVTVFGEVSGITPIDEFYYFEPGKRAFLCFPITVNFSNLLALLAIDPLNLGFGYYVNGIYTSSGLSWETKAGAPGQPDSTCLYLTHFSKFGGGKGSLGSISEVLISLNPNEFELDQNYPNPFNPTTKIKYSIPEQGYVSLKVYNALGSEVKNLVAEYKQAGIYEITFSGVDLPSGIYFYELRLNDQARTNKMMLIK